LFCRCRIYYDPDINQAHLPAVQLPINFIDGNKREVISQIRRVAGHMQRLIGGYLRGSIPRSLHIFRAKMSLIAGCRKIADRLFYAGLCHHACLGRTQKQLHILIFRCIEAWLRCESSAYFRYASAFAPCQPGLPAALRLAVTIQRKKCKSSKKDLTGFFCQNRDFIFLWALGPFR